MPGGLILREALSDLNRALELRPEQPTAKLAKQKLIGSSAKVRLHVTAQEYAGRGKERVVAKDFAEPPHHIQPLSPATHDSDKLF